MRNTFTSPFFLSFTIGIPFCIYKILFGLLAIRVGEQGSDTFLISFGYFVIIWATVDLTMNLFRAFLDLTGESNRIEFCSLAQIGRLVHVPLVFLSLDTLITFCIICYVLWSGWIILLSPIESYAWYFATTLNLISLSLVGLWTELARVRDNKNRSN